MNDKDTDITVYGATSFVAKHVLRYLIQVAAKDLGILGSDSGDDDDDDQKKASSRRLRVTLAGRNESKLKALRESLINESNVLGVTAEVVQAVISEDVVVAEGSDLPALQDMAKRTVVVLNCAGPYAKHSSKVVQACATVGTDYVDITGETMWASTMRETYGPDAAKSGSRIVPFCGYDSIPTDMAVFHAIQTLRTNRASANDDNNDEPLSTIEVQHARVFYQAYGVANGGTIHTALDIPIDLVGDFTTKKSSGSTSTNHSTSVASHTTSIVNGTRRLRTVPHLMGDPLCLAQPTSVRHNPEFQTTKDRLAKSEWMNQIPAIEKDMMYGISMPFLMSVVNLKVVHASAVALGYGENFTVHERMFPFGFTIAKFVSIMALIPVVVCQCCLILMMSSIYIPVIGPKIAGLFPPGTGMSDEMCKVGSNSVYCKVDAVEQDSSDESDTNKKVYNAYSYFTYEGDAGNYVTAQCVSEAALTLVLDRDDLPPRSSDGFGTPAEVLGEALVNRFQNTKVRPVTIKSSVDVPLM